MIDIHDLPDYVEGGDCQPALQAAVSALPPYSCIYAPSCPGGYFMGSGVNTLDKSISLVGDTAGGAQDGQHGGSVFWGTVPGPLWRTNSQARNIRVSDVGFLNLDPAGTGLAVAGVGVYLERLGVKAFVGIDARANIFNLSARGIVLRNSQNPTGSIGFLAGGHADLSAIDVVGYDQGIRAWNTGVTIQGSRLEVNRTALVLGMDAAGNNYTLSRSKIEGLSLEANDVGLFVNVIQGCSLVSIGIQGSIASPSHQSAIGMEVHAVEFSDVAAITINGSFSDRALKVIGRPKWKPRAIFVDNIMPGGIRADLTEIP